MVVKRIIVYKVKSLTSRIIKNIQNLEGQEVYYG